MPPVWHDFNPSPLLTSVGTGLDPSIGAGGERYARWRTKDDGEFEMEVCMRFAGSGARKGNGMWVFAFPTDGLTSFRSEAVPNNFPTNNMKAHLVGYGTVGWTVRHFPITVHLYEYDRTKVMFAPSGGLFVSSQYPWGSNFTASNLHFRVNLFGAWV